MTGDIAVQINKNSVVRDSIYGKRVRPTDVLLTGIIYGCAGLSILILAGIMGYVFVRGISCDLAFLSTASSATKGPSASWEISSTLFILWASPC